MKKKIPSFSDLLSLVGQRDRSSEEEVGEAGELEAEDVSPKAFLVISRNCSNCEKLIEKRDFRELLKLVNDVAIDEEAYLVGADFTFRNILERTLGYDTPAVVLGDDVIPYTKLLDLMYTEKRTKGRVSAVLNVLRRSKSGESGESSSSSKKSKRRSSFVEKQEMKRRFARAALGSCEGNVCREQ